MKRLITAAVAVVCLASATAAPLKFGVLSDVDSLPYLVARDEGLYAAGGVDVILVPFQSPVERDAALQAGAVDGVIGDVLGAALAVQNGFPLAIAAATDGRYLLLASPSSKAKSPADLAGVPVAGSTNTVIHYLVDRFLSGAGVAPADVKLLAVPKMPVRLEMLASGQVAAAGLPEPMATVARLRGARVLATSDGLGADPGVVLFTRAALEGRLAEVVGLLKAGAEAGRRINASPDRYRSYLVEKAGFPADTAQSFVFVPYLPPRVPTAAAVDSITGWMQTKGLLKAPLEASDLVDPRAIQALK